MAGWALRNTGVTWDDFNEAKGQENMASDRLAELERKAKEGTLTPEEARERAFLRSGDKAHRTQTVFDAEGNPTVIQDRENAETWTLRDLPNSGDAPKRADFTHRGLIYEEAGGNEFLANSRAGMAAQDAYAQQGTADVYDAYRDIATQGGMTAADRARMQQGFRQTGQQDRARREALQNQMAARGMAGQGTEMAALLSNEQATTAANTDINLGMNIASQQRADQALQGMGAMSAQYFDQGYASGSAQDAFSQYNAELLTNERRNKMAEMRDVEQMKHDTRNANREQRYQEKVYGVELDKEKTTRLAEAAGKEEDRQVKWALEK